MTLVVGGMVWVGYTITWWGAMRVKPCRVSWSDLTIPGRYKGCNPAGQLSNGGAGFTAPLLDPNVTENTNKALGLSSSGGPTNLNPGSPGPVLA